MHKFFSFFLAVAIICWIGYYHYY